MLYPGHSAEDDYPALERRLPGVALPVVHTWEGPTEHDVAALRALGAEEPLRAAALRARDHAPDAVMWACTSGSFVYGPEGVHTQAGWIADAAGTPASSTSLALLAALDHLGARRVAVAATLPGGGDRPPRGRARERGHRGHGGDPRRRAERRGRRPARARGRRPDGRRRRAPARDPGRRRARHRAAHHRPAPPARGGDRAPRGHRQPGDRVVRPPAGRLDRHRPRPRHPLRPRGPEVEVRAERPLLEVEVRAQRASKPRKVTQGPHHGQSAATPAPAARRTAPRSERGAWRDSTPAPASRT